VLAVLLPAAGGDDFELAVTDVDVNAGTCAGALGAGCGLLDVLATEFAFLAGAGVEGDFALGVAVAADVAGAVATAGGAATEDVSETVRTDEAGMLEAEAGTVPELAGTCATSGALATGLGAAAIAGAGVALTGLAEFADVTALGRGAVRGGILLARET
jgi:hypothetical protein